MTIKNNKQFIEENLPMGKGGRNYFSKPTIIHHFLKEVRMKKFNVFLSVCFLFLFSQVAIAQSVADNQTDGKTITAGNNQAKAIEAVAAPNETKQSNEIDDLPALENMFAAPVQATPTQQAPAQVAPVMPAANPARAPVQYEAPALAPISNQGQMTNQVQSENEIAEAKKLGPVIIGRVSEIDGELQRYIEETKEWVIMEKNTPLGVRDSIISGVETKAEVVFPNNVIWRMGGNTHATVGKLDSELLEITANAGLARFTNGGKAIISYVTDYGTVQADGGTAFEAYISEGAVEIMALRGTVNFIKGNEKFEIIAGKGSLLADGEAITAGAGYQNQSWTAWNNEKDGIWSNRVKRTKKFVRHLPKELYLDAYMLEENGQWVTTIVDGAKVVVYRPNVATDWQPFVNGSWYVNEYGDQTFISYDAFGYVTHHYGNWIMANGFWVWAPPYCGTVVVGSPYLPIEYAYYPGRVSWVNTGLYVGWVPLYYTEPYCPAYWGGYYGYHGYYGYYPYHDYYGNWYGHDYHHVDVYVHGLHYGDHAFYTHHNNFYGHHDGRGYGHLRFNGDHHQFSNLRAGNRFDGGNKFGNKRFQMSDRKASFRPDRSIGERMRNNNLGSRMGKRENAGALRNNLQNARRGNLANRPARSIMDRKGGGGNKVIGGGKRDGGKVFGGGNKVMGGGNQGGGNKVFRGGNQGGPKLGGGKVMGGGNQGGGNKVFRGGNQGGGGHGGGNKVFRGGNQGGGGHGGGGGNKGWGKKRD